MGSSIQSTSVPQVQVPYQCGIVQFSKGLQVPVQIHIQGCHGRGPQHVEEM